MINWIKNFFAKRNPHHAEYIWSLPETNTTTPVPVVKPPKGISEPVLSIVKTFSEKGRWKVTPCFDIFKISLHRELPRFTVTDTSTGETFDLYSNTYFYHYTTRFQFVVPDKVVRWGMPTWMTPVEGEYMKDVIQGYMEGVNERFKVLKDRSESKDQKQSKVNQDKERNRLMNLYCGEHK